MGLIVSCPTIYELRFSFSTKENLKIFCNALDEFFPGANFHVLDEKTCIVSKRSIPSSLTEQIVSLAKKINNSSKKTQ